MSTYPRRPKAKAFDNTVDVVELLVEVIGDGYHEDDKTIFQDIGASKAPQSDCPVTPTGSPPDCSAQPATNRANQPTTDCNPTPTRH